MTSAETWIEMSVFKAPSPSPCLDAALAMIGDAIANLGDGDPAGAEYFCAEVRRFESAYGQLNKVCGVIDCGHAEPGLARSIFAERAELLKNDLLTVTCGHCRIYSILLCGAEVVLRCRRSLGQIQAGVIEQRRVVAELLLTDLLGAINLDMESAEVAVQRCETVYKQMLASVEGVAKSMQNAAKKIEPKAISSTICTSAHSAGFMPTATLLKAEGSLLTCAAEVALIGGGAEGASQKVETTYGAVFVQRVGPALRAAVGEVDARQNGLAAQCRLLAEDLGSAVRSYEGVDADAAAAILTAVGSGP